MRIYIYIDICIYRYGLCQDIEATCGYTYICIYIYGHTYILSISIYRAAWGLGLKEFEFQRFCRA